MTDLQNEVNYLVRLGPSLPDYLAAWGYRGEPDDDRCPLAQNLSRVWGGLVRVNSFFGGPGTLDAVADDQPVLRLPKPLVKFVEAYDRGEHPQLLEDDHG